MIPAYAYVRVSGKSQIDKGGFDRQEEAIFGYATTHGYNIDAVFREKAISGTANIAYRPAFIEMIAAMLSNGVRTIIVEGLDRLAREYRMQEELLLYLAQKAVTLISARTQEDVTAAINGDPMKKALVQMRGVFAELEKSLLVAKLKHGREAKKKKNGRCEGRKPYSVAAPTVLALMRTIRNEGGTFGYIADTLNHFGHKNLSGAPFSAAHVRMILKRNPG